MDSLKFILNIYAGLSKTSNGVEWTFSTIKDNIHTVRYVSEQEHDMILLEKDDRIRKLEENLELAIQTLERAKEEINQSTKNSFWSINKEYLAEDHIKMFGPKYIDEVIDLIKEY